VDFHVEVGIGLQLREVGVEGRVEVSLGDGLPHEVVRIGMVRYSGAGVETDEALEAVGDVVDGLYRAGGVGADGTGSVARAD